MYREELDTLIQTGIQNFTLGTPIPYCIEQSSIRRYDTKLGTLVDIVLVDENLSGINCKLEL